jgi:hypothetical protein
VLFMFRFVVCSDAETPHLFLCVAASCDRTG